MTDWLIIADDLTGAADCASAFAGRGFDAVVSWGGIDCEASVLSVDTDSRHLPARAAAARQVAAQTAHWRPGMRLYKKIDSTLRGQPAAELSAQLSAWGARSRQPAPLAIVAPAFPATGRVMLEGRILLHELPLEQTPLWAREHTYANASLPDVLASAGLAAEMITLEVIRAGCDPVLARMKDAERRGIAAVVCDGASDADLAIVAAASLQLGGAIWVGSAGLGSALAAAVAAKTSPRPQVRVAGGPVLVVVGSFADVSRGQARALTESQMVTPVPVRPEILLAGGQAPGWQTAVKILLDGLEAGEDIAGIGPEIVMRSLAHEDVYARCRPLVVGDAERLRQAGTIVQSTLVLRAVPDDRAALFAPCTVDVVDLGLVPPDLPFGEVSAVAGEAAYRFIERACRMAVDGEVDAICTAPISKEALHAAGRRYPGHTELLAELTGTLEVSMMLTAPKLRVIHVTTHIGLIDAIEKIDATLVERTIRRGHATLVEAGIAQPRIGVCAINPHAGENGLFGRGEEASKIDPAVAACRAEGIRVDGPLPADTLFFRAARGDFDLVVAMYHDQGHGPIKVLGIEHGVNITVGLPVVRTSVDHGTAFDIAGTGRADERSLLEAIRQAVELAHCRS